MPKYIKYLENGTYKYATVKDVGDLLQLKTSTKKDIVSAINELIAGGISGGGSGGDGLTTEDIINIINGSDAVTDINSQIAQMVADIKANKDEFDKDVAETQKELNDRMDKVQTDIQKVIDDYQTAQDAKNKEQAENIENLNNENTQIKNDLAGAKEDLENVQGDLSNFDHDITEVKQSVDDVKGELDTKVSSTELDATNGRIDKTETDIAQNKKDIELKASQDSLNLLKGDVSKNTAALKVANDAIEGKVSREDLVNEVEDFTVKKANLFTGTREWQGWEESNSAEVIITDQKDNFGTATEFLNVSDYISLTVDNLKVGETYTISVSARSDKDTDGTVAQVFDIGEFQTTDTKDTFVRTTLQRYYVNFVATDGTMTFKLGAKSLANQAHLFLSKAKLETGTKATMWEDNTNDSYARIEKNDADVKVLADRVTSTVSKQKETDDKVTQNTTDIAQTAGKVETNIKALQSQDGRITENKAQITATANGLRTEFTQKTNDAIGAITDGGKNLILSSAFQTDPAMKNWQSVNNKVVVKEKNSQNWVYMSQSGLSTDSPIGLTSNYFAMKANDPLVIAFDIIISNVSKLDNKTVLEVRYYDKADKRVDFKDYTLADLGIKSPANGATNRAYIKVNTTHDDVIKGAILPRLSRNGEVWMSNFFAKISTISNGDYEVANADLEDMQSTDHFKLEQTAQGLIGKADTTQLNKLSGDLTTLSNNFSTTSSGFQASLSKIDDKVNNIQIGGRNYVTNGNFADGTNGWTKFGNIDTYQIWGDGRLVYSSTKAINKYTGAGQNNIPISGNKGDSITVSFDACYFGDNPSNYAKNINIITHFNDNSGTIVSQESNTIDMSYSVQKYSFTVKSTTDFSTVNVRFVYNPNTLYKNKLGRVKVEAGTKATDWTPAPEDTDSAIADTNKQLSVAKADIKATADNLSTNYTKTTDEHNYVNSQIKQSADKINLSVASVSDKIDANQTDTDSKIAALQIEDDHIKTTVSNKADTSYVDQKADQITSTVGNKADISYVDQQDKKIQSTVASKANASQITQLSNQINLAVKRTESEGTNLISNGSFKNGESWQTGSLTTWFSSAAGIPIALGTYMGFSSPTDSSQALAIIQSPSQVIMDSMKGNTATLSCYTRSAKNGGQFKVYFRVTDSNGNNTYYGTHDIHDLPTGWTRYSTTVKLPSDIEEVNLTFQWLNISPDVPCYITGAMLTMGDQLLPYQDSNLDVVNQINIDKSGVLISGDKVHITGKTTIDNASIDGAKIKNATIGNAQITGTLSGKTINGSTVNAINGSVTSTLSKEGIIQKSTDKHFNLVKNSEFMIGASTWALSKNAYTTSIYPTINGSNRVAIFARPNTQLASGWQTIAESNPVKHVPGRKYSASVQILLVNDDNGATVKNVNCSLEFLGSDFKRVKNYNLEANLKKYGTFQYLKIENITPPSNTKYVGMKFLVNGPGVIHALWSQPYITPFANVADYEPDTISSDNETRIENGYIDFPMNNSEIVPNDWINFNGVNALSSQKMGRGFISGSGFFIQDQIYDSNNQGQTLYNESLSIQPTQIQTSIIDNRHNNIVYSTLQGPMIGYQISKTDNNNSNNNTVASLNFDMLNLGHHTIFDSASGLSLPSTGSARIKIGGQEMDGGGSLYTSGTQDWYMRNHTGGFVTVNASGFTKSSTKASKKNITKADNDKLALDIYDMDITTFNYEIDSSDARDNIGAVIGDGYNINSSMLSEENDAIKLDNVLFALVGTVQKQAEQISELNARLSLQEMK